MEVVIGLFILMFVVYGIYALFSDSGSSSSSGTISQIDREARSSMRKASDDYLANVRDKTRR